MSMKSRLERLEHANGAAGEKGTKAMLRTAEERQIAMEVWLHGHQIMHDELDRKQAQGVTINAIGEEVGELFRISLQHFLAGLGFG